MTSGQYFVNRVIIRGSGWGQESGWLVSPLAAAALFGAAALNASSQLRLGAGGTG
ncbi:MAG TPA: hypothetical protein VFY45_00880 [Baekduia sp.]|nr:hypothetical protein [Baekduia sp.]